MDQPVGNYLTHIVQNPGPGPLNGVAILHYEHAADPTPLRKMSRPGASTPIVTDEWIVSQLWPNPILKQSRVYPVPKRVDRTIMIDFQTRIVGGLAIILINGHQFRNPERSYLDQIRDGVNVTDNLQVFEILQGQHIQFIMQNRAINPNGICATHPFHFHGRYFYVAATGPDLFDPERDGPLIDENVRASGGRLEFRDVFVQYPEHTNSTLAAGEGCGWVAIRLIANNPGIWLTHCHITSHMLVGKMFVIWEHSDLNPILLGE